MDTQQRLLALALRAPTIALPTPAVDLERFAVIACDQHTSNPDYWDAVEQIVGDSPSTLRLTLPELYLNDPAWPDRIAGIHAKMAAYLAEGVFAEHAATIVRVRRQTADGLTRNGFVVAVDLDQYDYDPASTTLIRASEQTIAERIPPRMRIRQGAALETTHVLVLYEDPTHLLVNAVDAAHPELLYDTALMLGGGRVSGHALRVESAAMDAFVTALEQLAATGARDFLYATGDGNHSLAAAKEVWRKRREAGAAEDDPYRFALVELVNVFDPGLTMHPIHRLVFKPQGDQLLEELLRATDARYVGIDEATLLDYLRTETLQPNEFAFVCAKQCGILRMGATAQRSAVEVVDALLNAQHGAHVDYVHGDEEVIRLAGEADGSAIILPAFERGAIFPTVASNGVLPKKAFSLGEAADKRYYLECRKLSLTIV